MVKLYLMLLLAIVILPNYDVSAVPVSQGKESIDDAIEEEKHNWEKMSSETQVVHANTHEYTAWHNFVKTTVKCDITHKITTDVWYCDIHGHTKTETSLDDIIHSREHH